MKDDTINIENFEELKNSIRSMKFSVEWRVTSDIGPEWIGSYRTIDFHLDGLILSETEFCKALKDKLIKSIPIPSESEQHVITGYGEIYLNKEQLTIDYDWDAAIPYQNPDESMEGKLLFFP